jgi:hypothetical protein
MQFPPDSEIHTEEAKNMPTEKLEKTPINPWYCKKMTHRAPA